MKMLVTGNIEYYGDFEVNKTYDIEISKAIIDDSGEYYFFENDDEKEGIIFIDCKDVGSMEYEFVKDRVEIFKDNKELAHYLINNVEGFADNIVNIRNMFI